MDDTNGVSKINSLQNGLLLQSNIHQLFDQYLISVNLDVSSSLRFVIYIDRTRTTTRSSSLVLILLM